MPNEITNRSSIMSRPNDSPDKNMSESSMQFYSRKMVKPEDLNPFGTLFGGHMLAWIDEEAAIYVSCQLGTSSIVTKYMSEIDFVNSARLGDIVEIGMETVAFGRTSITVRCEVRKKFDHKVIIRIEKIVFVHVDERGLPKAHGMTQSANL